MDNIRTHHDCHATVRPIAALAWDYAHGQDIPAHDHDRAQLIHALTGVMTVVSAGGSWVVPTGRAVWMPAGVEHEIRIAGAVAMRTVFVRPDARGGLPDACAVIAVSPLLREAIIAATAIPLDYDAGGRDQRVMDLILDELLAAPRLDLHVPLPRDPRLLRLCQRMIADPSAPDTLEGLAVSAHMSGRTLARLFQREVGMGFGDWRRRMRLLLSLPRLAAGASVLEVALEHGYDSPSAFTAMFRRTLGLSPTEYLGAANATPAA
ncbi:MAG: helix-turn-helix transcriptional regulator [Azospirillaceae bacterium]|nr:helix-turn-helix transcriptional regulator [Azospirillaceae bacterium]